MTNKENLGKQYAKVAEEAVSGWEKDAKQFDKMKSLQERSSMVIQLSEEKAQAEAEIEMLKKNMSVRSAEVSNKQHLEGVKKICKIGNRAWNITWSGMEEVAWAYSLGPDED
ncbi:hypothetical protein CQW23_30429 [Capsicum baccatum]|uniref:Uncharacterized protein n=1 Tax=Capsicum baccatum TaxID=33114 RepID=A0A2G2VAM0_CAPBA|nr:hypothetical protein CQW23_30429 [Capsicum baccatum]